MNKFKKIKKDFNKLNYSIRYFSNNIYTIRKLNTNIYYTCTLSEVNELLEVLIFQTIDEKGNKKESIKSFLQSIKKEYKDIIKKAQEEN